MCLLTAGHISHYLVIILWKKLVFFDLQFLGIHMCISIFLANICTNTLLPDHFENKTKNLHRYYMELILTRHLEEIHCHVYHRSAFSSIFSLKEKFREYFRIQGLCTLLKISFKIASMMIFIFALAVLISTFL